MLPKAAVKIICQQVEGTDAAFCLATYSALRCLANDEGAPDGPVALPINQIAQRAGPSYNKTAQVLQILKSLGILTITSQNVAGPQFRLPSVYSFPSISGSFPTLEGSIPTAHPLPRADIDKEQTKNLKESCTDSATLRPAEKPSKPQTPIQKDPLLAVLAGLDGSDPSQIPPRSWSGIAAALKDIRAVCAYLTAAELQRRATNYRSHFNGMALTPLALAKHWARCAQPPNLTLRPEPLVRKGSLA
jgi:hypothetical protein